MERLLLQRLPKGFGVDSGSELHPGVDSAIDSDSDLMMTILGWILGWILKMILGRSSVEYLLI